MLPPPMTGAIVPIPSEAEFKNMSLTEEEIDEKLLSSNAFEDEEIEITDEDEEHPKKKIRVRFKR